MLLKQSNSLSIWTKVFKMYTYSYQSLEISGMKDVLSKSHVYALINYILADMNGKKSLWNCWVFFVCLYFQTKLHVLYIKASLETPLWCKLVNKVDKHPLTVTLIYGAGVFLHFILDNLVSFFSKVKNWSNTPPSRNTSIAQGSASFGTVICFKYYKWVPITSRNNNKPTTFWWVKMVIPILYSFW